MLTLYFTVRAPQGARTSQVGVLAAGGLGEFGELAQQQRVLEDALDRLDEERPEGRRVLLVGVVRPQELLQRHVRL